MEIFRMRVTVIGGAGRMGQWFVNYFVNNGDNVTFSDIEKSESKAIVKRTRATFVPNNIDAVTDADLVLISTPIEVTTDVLIIESTYGSPSDKHPSYKRIGREFANAVSGTIKRGGKVIIPVFAVGRAQQVMLMLEDYMRSNYIDQVSVFIDGLIRRVNRVYELYWEWLKPEIQKRIRYTHSSPLESEIFYVVRDRDDVIESDGPCIILTTSGMLEGGPVLHYLKELGNDPTNMVCLTGYQAPKTRGRTLLDGSKELTLHNNDKIDISAEIMAFEFSAHADQSNIHRFISMLNGVRHVLCIHGEEAKTIALAKSIKKLKKVDAYAPRIGETINLG